MPKQTADRRQFLNTAFMAIVAAGFARFSSSSSAQSTGFAAGARTMKAGANASFGALKQIDAGVLNVGYAEAGPVDGKPVLLLHGWPYDIHSFVDVAPMLATRGYRVIVPHLRGYGSTRFLSAETFRNGEPAAVAVDITMLNYMGSASNCTRPSGARRCFVARLSARLPIFLSTTSSCSSSSEETSWKAPLMSALWRRKRGTNICRPFSVRDTVLTRRSSLHSTRLTKPFLYRRSTATLTDPGLR
jgi:hypothetical protein